MEFICHDIHSVRQVILFYYLSRKLYILPCGCGLVFHIYSLRSNSVICKVFIHALICALSTGHNTYSLRVLIKIILCCYKSLSQHKAWSTASNCASEHYDCGILFRLYTSRIDHVISDDHNKGKRSSDKCKHET